jgi:hypothetical protein
VQLKNFNYPNAFRISLNLLLEIVFVGSSSEQTTEQVLTDRYISFFVNYWNLVMKDVRFGDYYGRKSSVRSQVTAI